MIDLDIESAAANSLERIRMSQPKHHRQILAKIERLRRFINPPGKKKVRMKGEAELWRIPAGEYRIVYTDQTDGVRRITGIGKRNDGKIYDDTSRSR